MSWMQYIMDASVGMKAVLMILQRTRQGSITGRVSEVCNCSYNSFDSIYLKGSVPVQCKIILFSPHIFYFLYVVFVLFFIHFI